MGVVVGRAGVPGGHVLCESVVRFPRLTCEHLAEPPRHRGVHGGAGWQGPSAPDHMFSSVERALGAVEGLDEHELLPELDEADLPREGKRDWRRSPSVSRTHDPNGQGLQGHLLPTSRLFPCRTSQCAEPKNELLCDWEHPTSSCVGERDMRR